MRHNFRAGQQHQGFNTCRPHATGICTVYHVHCTPQSLDWDSLRRACNQDDVQTSLPTCSSSLVADNIWRVILLIAAAANKPGFHLHRVLSKPSFATFQQFIRTLIIRMNFVWVCLQTLRVLLQKWVPNSSATWSASPRRLSVNSIWHHANFQCSLPKKAWTV